MVPKCANLPCCTNRWISQNLAPSISKMTPFSRSTENFQSNGGIVLPSNLKTRREKGRKGWYRKWAFFAISYLTHTEKPIRNPDPDDPEPKNSFVSDPKTNSMDSDEKSRVSVWLREDVAADFVKWSQNVQIYRVVQIVEYLKILPPRFQKWPPFRDLRKISSRMVVYFYLLT